MDDLKNNEIIIYLANIKNKNIDDIFKDYKDYINEKDIEKMNRFKFVLDQKQSIMSSILKNKYVKGDIYYNKYNKPLADSVFFNISHSKNYVLLITSNKFDVGIDIEQIKDDINQDLINYVCNQDEINNIDSNKTFYKLWTQKEAVLKCKGTGLIKDIKNVLNANTYYLNSYFIDDYVYSIAVDNQNELIKIVKEKEYE